MASPLHPDRRPQNSNSNYSNNHGDSHDPLLSAADSLSAAPSAIPSPSKQTRRLQLRNAGFRGPTLPTRKVTPKSLPSSSTNWSSVSGIQQSSDAENVSPLSGKRATAESTGARGFGSGNKRESTGSGILQDIGNANATNPRQANSKRTRASITSGKFWAPLANESTSSNLVTDDQAPSPPPFQHSSSVRQRSARIPRAKMVRPRRSVSGETRKYVDHLEQQLLDAQSQLNAMTSPTVTRENSSKMRHLNAETKQLQEGVAAWEAKYEERVQEELDKHYQVELNLRARVRSLEEEAEEASFHIHDLETQLETTVQNMEAIEGANVNLEKRLEILSELLSANQTRIDLHAETPGRRRQSRPNSMLPRFPTAGSLATSPERLSHHTNAMSPSSFTRFSPPARLLSTSNITFSPEVGSDDGDASGASDMNSVIVAPPTAKRPARRMRRFGAGSNGPRPLILPSTSHPEQVTASAPAYEREDVQSSFPFSSRFDSFSSPQETRKRASSESSPLPPVRLSLSPSPLPSPGLPNNDDAFQSDNIGLGSPPSRISDYMTRDFSSMGSALGTAAGRNLMEELTAVQASEIGLSDDHTDETQIYIPSDSLPGSSPFVPVEENDQVAPLPDIPDQITPPEAIVSRFASGSSTAVAPSTAFGTLRLPGPPKPQSRSRSSSLSVRSNGSLSSLDSLRTIFSELFRSPVELAKHLVQRAQSRMSIPRPLLTVQWWLVGVLLGPMARRRMLGRSSPLYDNNTTSSSPSDESDPLQEEPLGYGSCYRTPPSSRSLVAGTGKKRNSPATSDSSSPCPNHPKPFKHSPWLWLKFSLTLAMAVGVAFKDGPSSLLKDAVCHCRKKTGRIGERANWRRARRDRILGTP